MFWNDRKVIAYLARIEAKIDRLTYLVQKETQMAVQEFEDLKSEVARAVGVEQSSKVLIQGLVDKLNALASQETVSPADIKAVADQLKASDDDLAAAVAAVPA